MPSFGPLAGIRILDLTMAYAGAHATMLLADLGAEVIKVESLQHYPVPTRGPAHPAENPAVLREYPDFEPGSDPWNRISWFNSHGRNKRDVTMDLEREEGRRLFLRLVAISDGLVENNTAGTLEKLGLAPDVLLQRNPSFIVVRMAPLGLSGPDVKVSGFGSHFEELTGLLSVQGYSTGEPVSSLYMDAASGPAGASAFILALIKRRRNGRGCVAEVAQAENLLHHMGDLVMDAAMNGWVPPRWGNRDPDFAPQGVYPCAGEDQWLALSVRNCEEWTALLGIIAESKSVDLHHLRSLTDVGQRNLAHDEIDAAIGTWTLQHNKDAAAQLLQNAGIPAAPVCSEADLFADTHLHERGFWQLLDHPSAGTHFHAAHNFQLSGTPPQVWRAAPTLGQDNRYVYQELLGVADDEYERLEKDAQIGERYLFADEPSVDQGEDRPS
jgi:crotonobetainyl-CoA:carnitine CoA-transferase CaiB-like acyl-CoA transferase